MVPDQEWVWMEAWLCACLFALPFALTWAALKELKLTRSSGNLLLPFIGQAPQTATLRK